MESYRKVLPVKKNNEDIKAKIEIIYLLILLKLTQPSEKYLTDIDSSLTCIKKYHFNTFIICQQKE